MPNDSASVTRALWRADRWGYDAIYLAPPGGASTFATATTFTIINGPGILARVMIDNGGASCAFTIYDGTVAGAPSIVLFAYSQTNGPTRSMQLAFTTGLTITLAAGTRPALVLYAA